MFGINFKRNGTLAFAAFKWISKAVNIESAWTSFHFPITENWTKIKLRIFRTYPWYTFSYTALKKGSKGFNLIRKKYVINKMWSSKKKLNKKKDWWSFRSIDFRNQIFLFLIINFFDDQILVHKLTVFYDQKLTFTLTRAPATEQPFRRLHCCCIIFVIFQAQDVHQLLGLIIKDQNLIITGDCW